MFFDNISTIVFGEGGKICASGDNFVKNKVEIKCDLVDMEAYALAKYSLTNGLDFHCFKYVSDAGSPIITSSIRSAPPKPK